MNKRVQKRGRNLKVTPEISCHVREGAAACGMSETKFAEIALREYFKARTECGDCWARGVNLVADSDADPEQIRGGGPLGNKIGVTPEAEVYIRQLESPGGSGRREVTQWWHDATQALIACANAAVWQEGPKWPFTVELRRFTEDECNVKLLVSDPALEVQDQ